MSRTIAFTLAAIGLILGFAVLLPRGLGAEELRSLRGGEQIKETSKPPEITRQRLYDGRLPRTFKEQPPLIPHKIAKYEIDLKVNQCLRCHGKDYYKSEDAPKLSESHYRDREGRTLSELSRRRWFCTQCHVPQRDAAPLVKNTFDPLDKSLGKTNESGAGQ